MTLRTERIRTSTRSAPSSMATKPRTSSPPTATSRTPSCAGPWFASSTTPQEAGRYTDLDAALLARGRRGLRTALRPRNQFHRPCLFPTETTGANGRVRGRYRQQDVTTQAVQRARDGLFRAIGQARNSAV